MTNQEKYIQECNNKWLKTRKPTLALAKRMVKKANPGIKNLKVAWDHKPQFCEMKGNRGEYFWASLVNVSGDGYKPKRMSLTVDKYGREIR